MIHLDTHYLIGLLVRGSVPTAEVDGWLAAGELLAASAMAWTEFPSGPVAPLEVKTGRSAASASDAASPPERGQ